MTVSKKKPALSFVHPSDLNIYYRNARVGDVDTIAGSLKVHGQYKPLIVNKGTHTGRPNEVLAGNHTLKAIRQLGEQNPGDERWDTVMVLFTDVDEDSSAKINLVDNEAGNKGGYDEQALYDQLSDLADIEGTGFTYDQFDHLADLSKLFTDTGEGTDGPEGYDAKDSTETVIELGKVPKQCAEVGLVVGVIRVKVPRDVYENWYDTMREQVGYDDKALQAEVQTRLGLA